MTHAVPERLPLREEGLQLQRSRDLSVRRPMRLRGDLQLRERLQVRLGEVALCGAARGALSIAPAPQPSAWAHPVLPGSPQEQSTQPRSAHAPHQRTTRFRNVWRARKSRTPALLEVMPASAA